MSSRVASRVVSSMGSSIDSSVYSSVSTSRARMLCQSSGKSVEGRQPRLREDARADGPHIGALDKTNASADSAVFHTSRAVAMNVAKWKQFELWQLEKCDLRIKAWEARDVQLEVRAGAKRECLSKLVVRLKHDRIDGDAEDERNEEGLRDCFFPPYYANPGVSPLRRRTECGVRRDSCAIVSFKTARRRVAQTQFAKSCVTVASGQFPQSKVACSQTLVSRSSNENSLFALDA